MRLPELLHLSLSPQKFELLLSPHPPALKKEPTHLLKNPTPPRSLRFSTSLPAAAAILRRPLQHSGDILSEVPSTSRPRSLPLSLEAEEIILLVLEHIAN